MYENRYYSKSKYTFTIDGEKLFLQFLLLTFATSFIYIACRSMRIVEKQYNRTCKKITKLKTRMDVVLAHKKPMCDNVLHYNVVRSRRSLVANYLKEMMVESQFEPEKFSNFFNEYTDSSSKQTSSCSLGLSERFDSNSKINTQKVSQRESSTESESGFGRGKNIPQNKHIREEIKNIPQNKHIREEIKVKETRKNEFKEVKTAESKIFKTLEGQNRRLKSSILGLDKRRPKISKWNLSGQKNTHEKCHNIVTVCNSSASTRSPFKVKSQLKLSSPKSRSTLKSSFTRKSDSLSWTIPSVMGDNQHSKKGERRKEKKFCLKKERSTSGITNVSENFSVRSLGWHSKCESESIGDRCHLASLDIGKPRQIAPLTTINEESAEENCPSE